MNIAIFEKAIDMFKGISDLCKKVIDAGDSEKYAKSVNQLNEGIDDTYANMRSIITNSEKFSDEEKIQKLKELAECEAEAKRKCGEAIQGNRENVAKISLEVLKGFLTCGISFAPAIIKQLKKATADDINTIIIDDTNSIEGDK